MSCVNNLDMKFEINQKERKKVGKHFFVHCVYFVQELGFSKTFQENFLLFTARCAVSLGLNSGEGTYLWISVCCPRGTDFWGVITLK